MKRLSIWLFSLFAFFGTLLLPLHADNQEYVIDQYGLISQSEVDSLNALAASYSREHDVGLYIRVYDDYFSHGYNTIESYAESIFINEQLDDDCLLLLITMADRSFDIFASYDGKCHEAFGTYAREKLADEVVPYMSDGNFSGAFRKFLNVANEYLNFAENGTPVTPQNDPEIKARKRGMASAVTFSIPEIIALVACFGMRSRMKTTGIKTEAREYIAKDGLRLTANNDIFLHRTETRTHIHRDNNSGGGGGSYHSSSGSFGSHTSGHF